MSERGSGEKFRLLDISSDQESSDLQLEIIPKKRKITRRERNRGTAVKPPEPSFASDLQCAIKWGCRGALIIWLVSLTWLSAMLYSHMANMKEEVSRVSTSSNGVSDALQICHTAAKELRANASILNDRLTELEKRHQELAALVQQTRLDLAAVNTKLSSAPSLADTPKQLEDLERIVSNLGSQISNFDSALQTSSKQTLSAAKSAIAEVEVRTNQTIANVTSNTQKIETLQHNLDKINGTVLDRVQILERRVDNITAPATEAPMTSSTTTSTTTTTTSAPPTQVTTSLTTPAPTQPLPQEVPAKPNVLSSRTE